MTFLAILVILGLVVYGQNRLYKQQAFKHLDYHCSISKHELFEGESFELVETLTNAKSLVLPWLKSELTTSSGLDFAESQPIVADDTRFVPSFFMLRGHQRIARHWQVTARDFGVHPIAKTVLVASDLFGFVTDSSSVPIGSSVTVLPRPYDLEALQAELRTDLGELVVRRRLLTDPFFKAGVRPYQPTDDLKQVHWYATAREAELMVYEQEATLSQSLAVILNLQSRSKVFDKGDDQKALRMIIRLASTIIDQTLTTGIPVRLLTNSGADAQTTTTALRSGREHAHFLLRTLASIPMTNTMAADHYFRDLNLSLLDSTDLVLISNYVDDAIRDFVTRSLQIGQAVKLVLTGPPASAGDLPQGCTLVPLYKYLQEYAYRQKETHHG